uniref:Uncharacterized protein n=1 Tax=Physcomitrium patens TaxID=3218 RepID=A0A2K1IXF0_PHYPA|nr:hypothetical protein PHYPA_023771 [Physcomitrium patens]
MPPGGTVTWDPDPGPPYQHGADDFILPLVQAQASAGAAKKDSAPSAKMSMIRAANLGDLH